MNPFKTGNRVLCIKGNVMPNGCQNSKLDKGEEYTVKLALGNYIVVLRGVIGHFSTDRFELIGRR